MTEEDYLSRFRSEAPYLKAWGQFVVEKITEAITCTFGTQAYQKWVKIPPEVRVKDESSLIAKAFVLNKGWFSNYEDITDKVGARFVLGLSDQIVEVSRLIEASDHWHTMSSKEFDEWREKDPRIFDYQSAHFIVTSYSELSHEGVLIPVGTKCEIQVRTLLQHAYAELSHDTLYKSNITSHPDVHRLFAKSMALMETTDDMLLRANKSTLTSLATVQAIKDEVAKVNALELSAVVFEPKSRENDYIIDQLRVAIGSNGLEGYGTFVQKFANVLKAKIEERNAKEAIYRIPAITLIYFLVKTRSRSLPGCWPFDLQMLEPIYSDLGIAPRWTKDI
ncbi:GTP pyrophosphokinase [Pseudomonas bijieensis]|uniref:RelA/SpoT domain-containing protein n=1 Tax=Pseudomonas bijieensis TaxID=2681983 RepID=A0A6N1CAM6_9PSED|nr:RelA/SpoT domain-containing protein [Pseudomonas bijieensis]QKS81655.1 RelA/SpoT domain-containing protein [Pseudomonas bijieensis]